MDICDEYNVLKSQWHAPLAEDDSLRESKMYYKKLGMFVGFFLGPGSAKNK